MRKEENWAIPTERVRHFFLAQPDVSETPDGFAFGSCQIRLQTISGQLLGKWSQERTILILEGTEADTTQIYQRFFLRFLSAGG